MPMFVYLHTSRELRRRCAGCDLHADGWFADLDRHTHAEHHAGQRRADHRGRCQDDCRRRRRHRQRADERQRHRRHRLSVTQFTVAGVAGTFTAGTTANVAGVGALVINADGSYTFTPAADYNGAVPVATYIATDGSLTSTATLTINVTAVNDAPVGVNDSATTPEDTPVSGNVLTNDTTSTPFEDRDSIRRGRHDLRCWRDRQPCRCRHLGHQRRWFVHLHAGGELRRRCALRDLHATDGSLTSTATLTLTITPVNDAPVGVDDSATTLEDTSVSGNVLTNDIDVDGPSKTVTQFTVAGVAGTFIAGTAANITGVGILLINAMVRTPSRRRPIRCRRPGRDLHADRRFAHVDSHADGQHHTGQRRASHRRRCQDDRRDGVAIGNVLTNDSDIEGTALTVTQFTVAGVAGTFTAGTTATSQVSVHSSLMPTAHTPSRRCWTTRRGSGRNLHRHRRRVDVDSHVDDQCHPCQ